MYGFLGLLVECELLLFFSSFCCCCCYYSHCFWCCSSSSCCCWCLMSWRCCSTSCCCCFCKTSNSFHCNFRCFSASCYLFALLFLSFYYLQLDFNLLELTLKFIKCLVVYSLFLKVFSFFSSRAFNFHFFSFAISHWFYRFFPDTLGVDSAIFGHQMSKQSRRTSSKNNLEDVMSRSND